MYLLPKYIARFKEAYPSIHVKLTNTTGKEGRALLKSDTVDFAVGTMADNSDDMVFEELFQYESVLITPVDHPLANKKSVTCNLKSERGLALVKRMIAEADVFIENFGPGVVDRLGPDVPMHFSAFHPDYKMRDVPATPAATLSKAREIAMRNGLRYAFTGNVHDKAGGSSYCHHCSERVIGRDWYTLSQWQLDEQGRCKQCGTRLAGVFEAMPGQWGARRMPVNVNASS